MPAARSGTPAQPVRWLLSDDDPTDWRGAVRWTFRNKAECDAAFGALPVLTDVQAHWSDLPDGTPVGSLVSEQVLTQAFSEFGSNQLLPDSDQSGRQKVKQGLTRNL